MSQLLQVSCLQKHYDGQAVLNNISFAINKGEFVSILGPSGCGKTTLLKLLGGFETPDSGEILYHGEKINHLTPQQRHLHTVFQNYALFPHLTVFDNVAFSLRAKGEAEDSIADKVYKALVQVKLTSFGKRFPDQLSGGEQQRVAIARAMVNKPDILLLDESLSALDSHLRKQMQIELKQLQRKLGVTFIYVTHSQREALSMSDRIIVLNGGDIQQIGSPRDIYEEPVNLFVAKFIGETNVFELDVQAIIEKDIVVNIGNKTLRYHNSASFKQEDKVNFIIRPEDIRVWKEDEVKDVSEMLPATVEEIIYKGSTVDLLVRLQTGKLLSATEFFDEDDENLHYTLGSNVWVHWLKGWELILPYEK